MTQRRLRTVRHEKPIDILPKDSVHAIREATFRVLETTGVEVRSERLLRELEKAGAIADHDKGHARFARETVEACLALVPDDLSLASREPGLDLHFDGRTGFLGVDGSAAEIADLHTGKHIMLMTAVNDLHEGQAAARKLGLEARGAGGVH